MAGGTGNKIDALTGPKLQSLRKIISCGVDVAKLLLEMVGDERPFCDIFISYAGEDRVSYIQHLKDELPSERKIFLDFE